MSIVPSGRRKMMKLQQSQRLVDSDPDAMQVEYADTPSGPSFDFQGLQDSIGQDPTDVDVPAEEDLQGAVDNIQFPDQGADVGVSDGGDGLGVEGNNIRDVVFKTLEDLGVPSRFMMSNGDALFRGEKDLSSGQLKGYFMLPTYTQGHKIIQEEAEKIAAGIGQQFGLQLKISHEKNNYKVSFQTQDLKPEGIGSSLDQLVGGDSSVGLRAASTTNEMIKEARNNLAETLLKRINKEG